MRFRVRDLLLFNVLAAIYLSACIQALKYAERNLPPSASISNIATNWAVMILVGTVASVAMWELARHFRLRRLSPIVAELPAPVFWLFNFLYAGVVLALSFLPAIVADISFGTILAIVFSSSFYLFCTTFLSLLHPYVSVGKLGIVHLAWQYPWKEISVERNTDGAIKRLRRGWRVNAGIVVEVPPELRSTIETVLPAIHSRAAASMETQ